MKMPKGVRLGVGLGCIVWSLICIPYAIIKYINSKEEWILYIGLFFGFLALLTGLFFIIFIKNNTPVTKDNVEPTNKTPKQIQAKAKKEKKPFISEKEWEELEEEDEEAFYIEEIVDDQ